MTETKLMGLVNSTTGALSDIKLYAFSEYDGNADLVDMNAFPTMEGPLEYDTPTKLAKAAVASITFSVDPVNLTANGVATATTVLTGPVDAVVDVTFQGAVPIDAIQYTLNGSGNATVTFGPTTLLSSGSIKVCFDLNDGSSSCAAELALNLV